MRNNGTRGAVEIAIQYEAQPSTVWSIETALRVPLVTRASTSLPCFN